MIHASNPTCKYPEHYCWQHCIVVYLKSEYNSPKKIGELVKVENVSFAQIAVIPAHTKDWEKIDSQVSEVIILSIEPNLLSHIAREQIEATSVELKSTFAQPDILIQSIALNLKVELDSRTSDRIYVESLFHALETLIASKEEDGF